jgi:alkanesulfonate monooxygenase SsuD/methylene tetrahydromethanopterin reductase-like flavin-dependent oxidoreductase (luciferase family)
LRFAVGVPNLGPFANPRGIVDLARAAEAAGWDAFFLWDHMTYRPPWQPIVDPWVVLGAVALSTERMRLGAMVTPLARRRPWKVARESATLDILSGGRLVFGAGLGAPPLEFSSFGEDADRKVRAEKLDEALEIIAGLWSGRPYSFRGTHHTVQDVEFTPVPIQRPRVPVWIGGRWPNRAPFRRAARWDGVFPTIPRSDADRIMTPDILRAVVDYTLSYRTSDEPFDVIAEGVTPAGRVGAEVVEPFEAAGLTWWIEVPSSPREPAEILRRRVEEGPPRG